MQDLRARVGEELSPAGKIGSKRRIQIDQVERATIEEIHGLVDVAAESRGAIEQLPIDAGVLVQDAQDLGDGGAHDPADAVGMRRLVKINARELHQPRAPASVSSGAPSGSSAVPESWPIARGLRVSGLPGATVDTTEDSRIRSPSSGSEIPESPKATRPHWMIAL